MRRVCTFRCLQAASYRGDNYLLMYACWLNTSTSQWTRDHVNALPLFELISSLFVSAFVKSMHADGCTLTCNCALLRFAPPSTWRLFWPSLEATRLKQRCCLQGILSETVQELRSTLEDHRQNPLHTWHKQRSMKFCWASTLHPLPPAPSVFSLHVSMTISGVRKR